MAEIPASVGYLKHKIVWCLIVLASVWLYLLYSRSYGAFAGMTVFVLIAAYAVQDDLVTNDIAAKDHFLLPDVD